MALIKREILTSRKILSTKSCTRNQFLFCKKMLCKIRIFLAKKASLSEEKLTHLLCNDFSCFSRRRMGKSSKLVVFWTRKLFQIRACLISARKAKQLEGTIMFTYSHANTPLGQSERAYYLSYFINEDGSSFTRKQSLICYPYSFPSEVEERSW